MSGNLDSVQHLFSRHGRLYAGHPRLAELHRIKTWMAGTSPGHDGGELRKPAPGSQETLLIPSPPFAGHRNTANGACPLTSCDPLLRHLVPRPGWDLAGDLGGGICKNGVLPTSARYAPGGEAWGRRRNSEYAIRHGLPLGTYLAARLEQERPAPSRVCRSVIAERFVFAVCLLLEAPAMAHP